ncbi:MAG: AMP-binding protein, partial [Treponema sp.]|nr:AMP-binding protein [Treponema sp.]
MNIMFLFTFGITLFQPPSMIYRFAVLQDRSIPHSPGNKKIAAYCKKVTIIWTGFFIFNGSIAAWTIFSGSDVLWSIYNGGISYILIGIIFAGEFFVRRKVQKNIPKVIPLTKINKKSREASFIMCYEDTWNGGKCQNWGDFLEGTAKLRRHINGVESESWILYCDDYWFFLLAFAALLQCKKKVILSANVSPAYLSEIRSNSPLLTDNVFSEESGIKNIYFIPDLLKTISGSAIQDDIPIIGGDETSIIMYTSGSTGKPKMVEQRLTEFENDNAFILSMWGDEFFSRKLCSTVNQHHIYGLLFSILLPFAAGVPFRRKRILVSEEFENFTDTKYMIITVPAFLKRAVLIESSSSLKLISPWIFTSGGPLDYDTAEKTSSIFGFWPVEVYGSTETSGIAWRQSRNGPQWKPFDNAQISVTTEGCLVIRSPYIRDKDGFETADLAEIGEDGTFLLKGRIDSVVKIEEKRISLTE